MMIKSKTLKIILVLAILLFIITPIRPSSATAHQNNATSDETIQLILVTDVSESMGYYVLSKDIPKDITIMQQRIGEIKNHPTYQRLTAELKDISETNEYDESLNLFYRTRAELSNWLLDNAYDDSQTTITKLNEVFAELGCRVYYAEDIVNNAEDLFEAGNYIDDNCKYADLTDSERQKIIGMVGFLEEPEYIRLRQDHENTWDVHLKVHDTTGYATKNEELMQFLGSMGYNDLEARLQLRAKELGYPNRFDLAVLTDKIILDLARLDQQASGRDTELGLIKFSELGQVMQPLTTDYDLMTEKIYSLGFFGASNLYEGLLLAVDEIRENADPTLPTAIILISDGEANRGLSPNGVLETIPPLVNELNTSICAAGFSNQEEDIEYELLQGLADSTGGHYMFASTGDELLGFITACRQNLVSNVSHQFAGSVKWGETVEAGEFLILENTDVFNVTLTFLTGNQALLLVDPSGKEVNLDYPGASIQESNNLQMVQIKNPEPNQWVVRVKSKETTTAAPQESSDFNVIVSTKKEGEPLGSPLPTPSLVKEPTETSSSIMEILPVVALAGIVAIIIIALAVILFLIRDKIKPVVALVIGVVTLFTLMCALIFSALIIFRGPTNIPFISRSISEPEMPIPTRFEPTESVEDSKISSSTPEPTQTLSGTPTSPPEITKISTPISVPITINTSNVAQLIFMENLISNDVPGYDSSVCYALDFSPDGRMLAMDGYYYASGKYHAYLKLWQLLPEGILPYQGITDMKNGHIWNINSIDFSPDGKRLATSSYDKTIKLWDVADGSLSLTLDGHDDIVWSAKFSPDGRYLASASDDKTVNIWDLGSGELLKSLRFDNWAYNVDFSPAGDLLATGEGGHENPVRIWSVPDGQVIRTLIGDSGVLSVAFSPDGKLFAAGTMTGDVWLYEVDSWQKIYTLKGHQDEIWDLAFSRDGDILASGSNDMTVKLWDVNDGSLARDLTGFNNRIYALIFSPDGSMLLTGSMYDGVKIWKIKQ